MPATPLVSVCVPTFNRSRYLDSLLNGLVEQFADFAYPWELVIADNASPDATQQVIERFRSRLPIRAFRHAQNIGGYPNWQFVMSQATGRYLVYLSDDDCLLGAEVAAIVAQMEAEPALAVVYAPWLEYDLVAQRPQGLFFEVPADLRVERGRHDVLLDHLLAHHVFPEIGIVRRDAFAAVMPRIHEHAFLAFMHASEYLRQGAVLIRRQPYYVAVTRYFADEPVARTQLGTDEAEQAWDRYRGGLEYTLARSGVALDAAQIDAFQQRIQEMVASRMAVAVRLRHARRRDPIDTWTIAMRLRGMGYERLLPLPLAQLASEAMLHFMLTDPELHRGARQIVCVGRCPEPLREHLRLHAAVPLEFADAAPDAAALSDTLLLDFDDGDRTIYLTPAARERGVRLVRAADLMARFGL